MARVKFPSPSKTAITVKTREGTVNVPAATKDIYAYRNHLHKTLKDVDGWMKEVGRQLLARDVAKVHLLTQGDYRYDYDDRQFCDLHSMAHRLSTMFRNCFKVGGQEKPVFFHTPQDEANFMDCVKLITSPLRYRDNIFANDVAYTLIKQTSEGNREQMMGIVTQHLATHRKSSLVQYAARQGDLSFITELNDLPSFDFNVHSVMCDTVILKDSEMRAYFYALDNSVFQPADSTSFKGNDVIKEMVLSCTDEDFIFEPVPEVTITPEQLLPYAVLYDFDFALKLIDEYGADPTIHDNDAIKNVKESQEKSMALLERGADIKAVHDQVIMGNEHVSSWLKDYLKVNFRAVGVKREGDETWKKISDTVIAHSQRTDTGDIVTTYCFGDANVQMLSIPHPFDAGQLPMTSMMPLDQANQHLVERAAEKLNEMGGTPNRDAVCRKPKLVISRKPVTAKDA